MMNEYFKEYLRVVMVLMIVTGVIGIAWTEVALVVCRKLS